jgi:hypothetical protein
MTTYVAFSEIEALDIIPTGLSIVTTGVCVEANVNRAAIQLGEQAQIFHTFPTGINEGWFHSRMRLRTGSASSNALNDYMMAILDENNNIIAGFYDNRNSSGGVGHIPQLRATMFSDPNIGVANSDTTGTFVLTPDTSAYLLDIYFRIHDTLGIIRWYVNGTLVREFLGDTQNGASSLIKKIRFRTIGRNGDTTTSATIQLSQVLVSNLPTINARVHTVALSVGSVNEWTGAVTDINGSENSPGTIMTEATIGEALIMATANSAAFLLTGNEIKDVIISASALKLAGSLVNGLTGKVKIGATEYDADPKTLTTGFTSIQHKFALNPATGVQWTIADINAAELGIETVA